MSAVPALEARNLFKIFGREPDRIVRGLRQGEPRDDIAAAATVAVDDASLTVAQGELVVVAGLPGSGKSTLLRMLGGVLPPTHGEVLIAGVDVNDDPASARTDDAAGAVFADLTVLPHLSVIDNVAHGWGRGDVDATVRDERVRAALGAVDLAGLADRLAHDVDDAVAASIGLARSLATDGDVVLFDDPFSGFDASVRLELQQQLLALRAELDRTVVFLTREVDEAVLLGDRVAVMCDGRITRHGTPDEILAEGAREHLAPLVEDAELIGAATAEEIVFADLEAAMVDRDDDGAHEPIVWSGPLTVR